MSRSFRHDPDAPDVTRPRRDAASEPAVFRCQHCRAEIVARPTGTQHRNHCPHCLWSVHLDERPGDRRSACGAGMEPIAIWVRPDGEWALVHRCSACHAARVNRIAGDDNEYALLALAARPMAMPPFPLSRLRR
jgi:DNA-directed RNA polymerase subunit RPC12/RpoP